MSRANSHRRAVEAAVEALWTDWSISQTAGKHLRITLRKGDRSRFVITSLTPGDHRAIQNFRTELRRAIRELKEQTA